MIATHILDLSTHIKHAVAGEDLGENEMEAVVGAIADGASSPAQTAALLVALAIKGEGASELVGAARALRSRAVRLSCDSRCVADVCGTGGDASGSFNVSTAVAFVVAGAGVAVAKHGNRAMSGSCGSADVAEALGARLDLPPAHSALGLKRDGIAFLFAQAYHPALRSIAPVRREIAVRTLFNLVGPLVNPAGPSRQLVGVSQKRALRPVVEALAVLGSERCAAVRGEDGIDEVSVCSATRVVEWTGTKIIEYVLEPQMFGIDVPPAASLRGGDAARNADIIRSILNGELGPMRDIVLINAALALTIAGAAPDLASGFAQAQAAIDSGAARAKLDILVAASQR
jgi:anthranilate phosphoribosyltransferase